MVIAETTVVMQAMITKFSSIGEWDALSGLKIQGFMRERGIMAVMETLNGDSITLDSKSRKFLSLIAFARNNLILQLWALVKANSVSSLIGLVEISPSAGLCDLGGMKQPQVVAFAFL